MTTSFCDIEYLPGTPAPKDAKYVLEYEHYIKYYQDYYSANLAKSRLGYYDRESAVIKKVRY